MTVVAEPAMPIVNEPIVAPAAAIEDDGATKAKDVLGFEATTTLEDMLDEVIPWIENAMAEGAI